MKLNFLHIINNHDSHKKAEKISEIASEEGITHIKSWNQLSLHSLSIQPRKIIKRGVPGSGFFNVPVISKVSPILAV